LRLPFGAFGGFGGPYGVDLLLPRVFTTDEAEQLFDRKLHRSMDGLGDMMERMMERMMDMMAMMERERREDQERMERNRRDDHERLMERLLQMFVEALAVHGAGSVPPLAKRTPTPPAESRMARTPTGESCCCIYLDCPTHPTYERTTAIYTTLLH
jgi:hypothetical protein